MRPAAKQHFRQPSSCEYCTCGIWIKCDMYRPFGLGAVVAVPVSWCTVWKGTPQDCMDHVRGVHDVPWEVKSASLEHFLPPWIVRRQVLVDSLKPQHSGISTDILLFSDIHLSLVHHYRIHKRGLPHVTLRWGYMSQLRALLPVPVAQPVDGVLSPASTGPGSAPPDSSSDHRGAGFRVSCGFPAWGANCCCGPTENARLISGPFPALIWSWRGPSLSLGSYRRW